MNRVELIGRLTKDPETSKINDVSKTSFTLAVDRRYTDKNGNRQADFLPCVAWKGTADFIAKYFTKGKKIAVVGSVQTRNYEAQDGTKKYVTEIIVDEAEFVESRNAESTQQPVEYKPGYAEAGMEEDPDDELPFD